MYYKEPDDPPPSFNTPGPQLVPANDLEDAIATMLRMFNQYVTEPLLKEYLDVVSDQPAELVYRACKDWIKAPPENRAARAHELRAKARALAEQATAEPKPWQLEPPPRSPHDVDAIYAALAREHPDNAFLQARIAARARARAAGHPLDGAQEIAGFFDTEETRVKTLPPAAADERAP